MSLSFCQGVLGAFGAQSKMHGENARGNLTEPRYDVTVLATVGGSAAVREVDTGRVPDVSVMLMVWGARTRLVETRWRVADPFPDIWL